MSEKLPDGTYQGWFSFCPKCRANIEVNMQGNDISGHLCQHYLNSRGIEVSTDNDSLLVDCINTDKCKIYFDKKEAVELRDILNNFILTH